MIYVWWHRVVCDKFLWSTVCCPHFNPPSERLIQNKSNQLMKYWAAGEILMQLKGSDYTSEWPETLGARAAQTNRLLFLKPPLSNFHISHLFNYLDFFIYFWCFLTAAPFKVEIFLRSESTGEREVQLFWGWRVEVEEEEHETAASPTKINLISVKKCFCLI